jgi:hypothetical protein
MVQDLRRRLWLSCARPVGRAAVLVAALLLCPAAALAADGVADPRGLAIFTEHLRPLLAHRCGSCHGAGSVEGEFDLSTRETLRLTGPDPAERDPDRPGDEEPEPDADARARPARVARPRLDAAALGLGEAPAADAPALQDAARDAARTTTHPRPGFARVAANSP